MIVNSATREVVTRPADIDSEYSKAVAAYLRHGLFTPLYIFFVCFASKLKLAGWLAREVNVDIFRH